MIFKSENKSSDLNGFLDTGSHFHGVLRFETTFRVDGKLEGSVVSSGDLIVGQAGEFEGQLEVGQVIVSGLVRGKIKASRRVQITASGRVFAEIETPSLMIEDGAVFEGRCAMSSAPAEIPPVASPADPKEANSETREAAPSREVSPPPEKGRNRRSA